MKGGVNVTGGFRQMADEVQLQEGWGVCIREETPPGGCCCQHGISLPPTLPRRVRACMAVFVCLGEQ